MTLAWFPCEFEQDGIRFRVRPGKKRPRAGDHKDLVMEWQTPTGWVPLRFLTVGLIFDFLAWNEEGLYPTWDGWNGGKELLDYLKLALTADVDVAEARLQAQKAARAARNNQGRTHDRLNA